MDFCTVCGTRLATGQRFCVRCGAPTPLPSPGPGQPGEPTEPVPAAPPGPATAGTADWVNASRAAGPLAGEPTEPLTTSPPAGWYPDPAASGQLRYWDGGQWTGHLAAEERPGPGGSGGRRGLLVVGLLALLAAGIAGALVYLLSSRQPRTTPAARSTSNPTAAPTPTANPTPSPAPTGSSPSPGPTPSPSLSPGAADTGPVSADPDAPAVGQTLTAYFGGIDTHNYARAYAVFSPAFQARIPYPQWAAGDSTSRDTRVKVVHLAHQPDGDLLAAVTFRSAQAPQDGPTPGQTCTLWALTYTLVPGNGAATPYLIDSVSATDPASSGHRPC